MSIVTSAPTAGDWDYRAFSPIPFDQFRVEVLALYVPPLRSKNTFYKVRQVLAIAAELVGPEGSTADINPNLVSRFIASRPADESTISTHCLLGYLRSTFSYAKSQGYIRTSPFDYRRKWVRAGKPVGKKHHSREDIKAVLDLLSREAREKEGWARWRASRLYALASLFAYTGLRKMEGLTLHIADIDVPNRMIYLTERKGHGFKTRDSAQPVPIPDELAPILENWIAMVDACEPGADRPDSPHLFPGVTRKGPWTGGPQGGRPLDEMLAAGERSGVRGFTFLSLRHSFATMSEAWNLSPSMLQRILRHTSLRTQLHYRHADPSNMRAAVKGISFNPPTDGEARP